VSQQTVKPMTPALFALIQARMAIANEARSLPPHSVRAAACQSEVAALSDMIRARQ